jgi:CrcB protein
LFAAYTDLSPQWRLLIVTGFCGGLTTFSTFSAELVLLMQQGRLLATCAAIAAHVGGSIIVTFAGIGTIAWIKS